VQALPLGVVGGPHIFQGIQRDVLGNNEVPDKPQHPANTPEYSSAVEPGLLQAIVSAGASVNCAAYDGRTPLHLASAEGHADLVRYIIAAGGRPDARDRWGRTPLADAVAEGHAAVEHALRLAGSVGNRNELLRKDNSDLGRDDRFLQR
jgi:hypothetical protein